MRCLPVLVAVLAAIAVLPATAQSATDADATAAMARDLWCGVAFDLAVPETAASEVKSVTDPYRAGATLLLDRAKAAYLELGFTDESFADLVSETEAEVTRQITSTDPAITPQHSFEDCAALIGQ